MTSQEHPSGSSFLELPFEIRIQIYTPLLSIPSSTTTNNNILRLGSPSNALGTWSDRITISRYGEFQSPKLYAQILRTCTQCNCEASPVLYRDRALFVKGEEHISALADRFQQSSGLAYISTLQLASTDFGILEAAETYPAILAALPYLRRFDFSPTVSQRTVAGCEANTLHWKCTSSIPCTKHIAQTKEFVTRLAAGVMARHPNLRVLVGSRKAILPVYSLVAEEEGLVEEVVQARYSKWDTVTKEGRVEVDESLRMLGPWQDTLSNRVIAYGAHLRK